MRQLRVGDYVSVQVPEQPAYEAMVIGFDLDEVLLTFKGNRPPAPFGRCFRSQMKNGIEWEVSCVDIEWRLNERR